MDVPTIPLSQVRVTAESVDPVYNQPVVEIDEQRAEPVPHRYVHGRFDGTEARFSFYFPPAAQYEGRFFHNTYPMALVADIGPFPIEFEVAMGDLGFTLDSGAFYVQTNNGGLFRVAGADPAIAAYRVNAAAAKFARKFSQEVYGPHKVHGYLFGGSGGAYQTQGAAENTSGVWDGFVPFVPGCDHAIPSMMSARMHALRVLRQRDRFPGIANAMEPGGSGDPYADLNEEEAAALRELTLLGHPLRGWYKHAALDSGYFANISGMMPVMDPTYAEDFWSKPGYLGTDAGSAIGKERAAADTTVTAVSEGFPKTIDVADLPQRDWADAHLVVLSGAAAGATLPIKNTHGKTVALIATADPAAVGAIRPGDKVRVDNAWALALQTYHRHQVPATDDYYAWNQYRDPAGAPVYPQRDVLIGQTGTVNAAGSIFSGKVNGKTLMLSALMDIDAYAWQADWYRSKVKAALGEDFADTFALYYFDNAHHENPMTPLERTHVVSYGGALQQALRDLAAWVEKGVHPSDTVYRIEDTQVVVPDDAAARKGIQPTVALTVNGGARAEAKPGEPVRFSATIAAPPGAGKIVSAEWDFDGSGTFTQKASFSPAETVTVSTEHAFAEPGTHFAALRVALQREGRADTPYGRVQNIARARVVVG
jgi:hypothetical protein